MIFCGDVMEKKISVDWEKWEKREHPGMSTVLSLTIVSLTSIIGFFYNHPYIFLGIGCLTIGIVNLFIKIRVRYKHDEKETHSTAAS